MLTPRKKILIPGTEAVASLNHLQSHSIIILNDRA